MPKIPAPPHPHPQRWRQEDCEYEASLGYVLVNFRPQDLFQKIKEPQGDGSHSVPGSLVPPKKKTKQKQKEQQQKHQPRHRAMLQPRELLQHLRVLAVLAGDLGLRSLNPHLVAHNHL